MNTMRYIIVRAASEFELECRVNELMQLGGQPTGGVVIQKVINQRYMQSMLVPQKEE